MHPHFTEPQSPGMFMRTYLRAMCDCPSRLDALEVHVLQVVVFELLKATLLRR